MFGILDDIQFHHRNCTQLSQEKQLEVTPYFYTRGLKLKWTRGPHETQNKISRAALQKWKKFILNFVFFNQYIGKNIQKLPKIS